MNILDSRAALNILPLDWKLSLLKIFVVTGFNMIYENLSNFIFMDGRRLLWLTYSHVMCQQYFAVQPWLWKLRKKFHDYENFQSYGIMSGCCMHCFPSIMTLGNASAKKFYFLKCALNSFLPCWHWEYLLKQTTY